MNSQFKGTLACLVESHKLWVGNGGPAVKQSYMPERSPLRQALCKSPTTVCQFRFAIDQVLPWDSKTLCLKIRRVPCFEAFVSLRIFL